MSERVKSVSAGWTGRLGPTLLLALSSACIPIGSVPTVTNNTFTPSTASPTATSIAPPPAPTSAPPATPSRVPLTASPIPEPTATPTASSTDLEQPPPPPGEIRMPDGSAVTGVQGSWCYDRGCLDAGPLPRRILPVLALPSPGTELAFTLADTHPFTYWRADYSTGPDDDAPKALAAGGEWYDPYLSAASPGPPLSTFTFDGPASGDWRLEIHVQFADLGATVYYWHALVP